VNPQSFLHRLPRRRQVVYRPKPTWTDWIAVLVFVVVAIITIGAFLRIGNMPGPDG
jgi:hypothetical protein